jgi:hypothetical protein
MANGRSDGVPLVGKWLNPNGRGAARAVSVPRSVLGAALICAVLLGSGGSASASSSTSTSLLPGMIVARGGLSAIVPQRGEGVGAEAWLADGGSISLRVMTRLDGRVRVTTTQTPAGTVVVASSNTSPGSGHPDATIQSSPPPCQDRAYNLTGSWWRTTVDWWFRSSSTPSNLSHDAARKAIKSGASHITHAFNDCGRADHVSATGHYAGSTSISPNIGSDSTCQNPDGRNVVGFGDLLGSQLALTCWWFRGSTTVEADMKVNRHDFRWTTTTAGCSDQYMVQAVATHEFGHVFGLAHVSQSSHGNLTMSTSMFACDNSPSTLGLGDMLGLEARY